MQDEGLVDVTLLSAARALELLADGRMSAEAGGIASRLEITVHRGPRARTEPKWRE